MRRDVILCSSTFETQNQLTLVSDSRPFEGMPKIAIKSHKELAQMWQSPKRIYSLGVLGCPSE